MCHEDDAIMHELQASALCNQVHYCIIHIKRRKLSWACYNCFIAGHMTSVQPDTDVDFKDHLLHTYKCALSDLMHCFRSIWLVGCHVTSNNMVL